MPNESAGLHVIMDGYVADEGVFTREKIAELFARLIAALDMKALDAAMIYEVPVDPEVVERVKRTGVFEDSGGITGVQVISTSHLSIHAWPVEKFFSLDAFSCKDFDANVAMDVIRNVLGVTADNTTVAARRKPHKNL